MLAAPVNVATGGLVLAGATLLALVEAGAGAGAGTV